MNIRPKTIFCDIDGTLVKHSFPTNNTDSLKTLKLLPGTIGKISEWDAKGYNIILTTGRRESMRKATEEQLAGFNELVKNHPITIEEKHVVGFANQYLEYDSIWKKYGSLAENTTVYYEDLLNPISLPILDLHEISFLNHHRNTSKLPEKYKNKLFANITEIGQWMEKHYYEHRT